MIKNKEKNYTFVNSNLKMFKRNEDSIDLSGFRI